MTGGKAPGIDADASRMRCIIGIASGLRLSANGADIPNDRPPGLEVGRQYQQQPSPAALLRNTVKHRPVNILGCHPVQRSAVGHGVARDGCHEGSHLEYVLL
jgi:hypothetical protein